MYPKGDNGAEALPLGFKFNRKETEKKNTRCLARIFHKISIFWGIHLRLISFPNKFLGTLLKNVQAMALFYTNYVASWRGGSRQTVNYYSFPQILLILTDAYEEIDW